jgi:hypothetical protein
VTIILHKTYCPCCRLPVPGAEERSFRLCPNPRCRRLLEWRRGRWRREGAGSTGAGNRNGGRCETGG